MSQPRYQAPIRPSAVGGNLPFNGPYAQSQMQATHAYENALAQIQNGRNNTLASYGYTAGPHNSIQVDTGNPYSPYEQMQEGITNNRDQFAQDFQGAYGDTAQANMDSGAGAYQIGQARKQQEGVREDFAHRLSGDLSQYNSMKRNALLDYNNAQLDNRMNLINYLQSHQQFTQGKPVLSNNAFNARIKAVQQAWGGKFGNGPRSENKKGLTFQQRMDSFGTKLWDPSFHPNIAGVRF